MRLAKGSEATGSEARIGHAKSEGPQPLSEHRLHSSRRQLEGRDLHRTGCPGGRAAADPPGDLSVSEGPCISLGVQGRRWALKSAAPTAFVFGRGVPSCVIASITGPTEESRPWSRDDGSRCSCAPRAPPSTPGTRPATSWTPDLPSSPDPALPPGMCHKPRHGSRALLVNSTESDPQKEWPNHRPGRAQEDLA